MTAIPPHTLLSARRIRSLSLWLLLLLGSLAGAAPLGVTLPLLNGTLDAQYILESDPNHDALRVSTSARVVRNRPLAAAADVTVRWRATLRQGTTTVAQISKTTVHSVPGVYDDQISTSIELDPPGILSDDGSYSLLLEVHYINDPAVPASLTAGDTETLTLLNFGHFSGVVKFGAQTGTLSSFGNPTPHFLGNGNWQLAVYAGTLANGLAFANSVNSTPLAASRSTTTGDLTVTAGTAEINDGDGTFTWNAWSGVRGPVLMGAAKIEAKDFRLTLPPGVGWRDGTTGVLRRVFRAENVALPLTPALQPSGTVSGAIPAGREFVGAALPVAFTPATFKFDGTVLTLNTPGTRFLRQSRYQQEIGASGKLPRSNDSYFRFLQASASGDLELRHNLAGAMTVTLRTNGGDYTTHFPEGDVGGLASSLRVVNDSVSPASSNVQASWVHLQYGKGCPQSSGHFPQGMRILAPVLTATPQGGITATGSLATNAQFGGVARHLEVGRNSGGEAVHRTDEFTTASFYAPGFSAALANSPADFLLAEIRPNAGHVLGLPGSAAYAAGLGLYAGFNFEYPNAMHVRSRTGGAVPIEYEVSARRAYARLSGVSGVIQAQAAELPFQADIYGFAIGFTEWAFNFLSNEMRESFIEGQVDLTGTPADFTQGMKNVRISCCGNLERFDIPEGEANKRLGHWDSFEIRNSSARFVTPAPCDSSEAVLAYSTTVHINGLPGRKAGKLAFTRLGKPTVPADDAWDYAPSYLSLEPQSGVAGQYRWWPRGDAYFSNPEGQGAGFVTAAGDLDTPFFNLSTVRLHTTAVPEVEDEVLVGFMHGDFLTDDAVDMTHRGTPGGMSAEVYRDHATYRPTASAPFFGKENAWGFPVQYHPVTGNFYSPDDRAADLWVAEFQSRISRLNAELAHVRFGAQITGFTEMSVGTLIEHAAEYGAQGLADVVSGEITGPVKEGLLGLAETLDNKLEKLLSEALNQVLATPAGDILEGLRNMNEGWGEAEVNAVILGETEALKTAIRKLGQLENGAGDIASAIGQIDDRLGKVEHALTQVILLLSGDPSGLALGPLEPLVIHAIEQFGINPAEYPVDQLTGIAAEGILESAGLLEGLNAGWIADAREALVTLRDVVAEVRVRLSEGEEFFQEVSALFGDAAELVDIVDGLRLQIKVRLTAQMQGRLEEFTDSEILDVIRGAVRDNLFGSLMSVRLQSLLRARLGYLDTMVNEAINFAMQSISEVLIQSLQESGALDALDDGLQTLTGALDYLKAARINGEAITRGDRLAELAIQAKVDFSIPTPAGVGLPMSADALFKWQERVSDGDTPCDGPAGQILPEVILKASGGSAIGFGLDSRASIALKFAFDSDYTPVGFAGVFQIDSSELNVSGMGIQDFTGTLALGQDDYYLSAHALGSFGAGGTSIDLEGGFFIGQACNDVPFAFYPNFPEGGGGPYLGFMAHLSGKAPLMSAGGLLNVTIGAEIGGYTMVNGGGSPVIGGHLGGSISGEVLFLLKATGFIDLGYGFNGVHQFTGDAGVEVKLGFEPFQITRSREFHVVYTKPAGNGGGGTWEVEH